MSKDTFEVILLTGRPASGKSEILDFLQHTLASERQARFHIGELDVLDDFPMLWTWFEEDDLLSQMGYPRLHSSPDGYFLGNHLWDLEAWSIDVRKPLQTDEEGLCAEFPLHLPVILKSDIVRFSVTRLLQDVFHRRTCCAGGPIHRVRQGLLCRITAQEPAALQPRSS